MSRARDFDLTGFNIDVGERVRLYRKRTRQTQQALADAVGVSRPAIANIESGRQRVPLDLLWRIAAVTGFPFAQFVPESVARARDVTCPNPDCERGLIRGTTVGCATCKTGP